MRQIFMLSATTVCSLVLLISCSQGTASSDSGNADNLGNGPSASAVIDSMGAGFNLGNTFDNGLQSTDPATIRPIIDLYSASGMRHIRIPVTWMEGFGGNTLANASGEINTTHPRFLQLKAVIDYAIHRGLFVVINAHHEHAFKAQYDGSAAFNDRFTTLWKGIANSFKEYSFQLVFELLNEPEGAFGDWNGGTPSPFDPGALALTRQVYEVGYKAVRETGGRNATRIIMISTNGFGNHSTIEEVYPAKENLPGGGSDQHLAIQVHTYDPWAFCGQNGSNSAYPGMITIQQGITQALAHGRLLDVPINYGEFGVGRASNVAERNTDVVREFYRIVVVLTRQSHMSSTVWDDRGWFGLIEPDGSGGYRFLYNIVPTMIAP